jgi:hypothetical protein
MAAVAERIPAASPVGLAENEPSLRRKHMGVFKDDNPDDGTIGVPSQDAKNQLIKKLKESGRPPVEKGGRPQKNLVPPAEQPYPQDQEDYRTIVPPPNQRHRSSKSNSPPFGVPSAGEPQEPPPRPQGGKSKPERTPKSPPKPVGGMSSSAEHLATAMGPPTPYSPPQSDDADMGVIDDQPWTSAGLPLQTPGGHPKVNLLPSAPAHVNPRPVRFPSPPDTGDKTVGYGSGMVQMTSRKLLMLQFWDGESEWRDLEQVKPNGHVIGRESLGRSLPGLDTFALQHLRISSEGDRLFAEPLKTINGVYMKVLPGHPVELVSGMRFQVGRHVIEFHLPAPHEPVVPMRAPDGEVFRSRELDALAYLVLIGADNQASLTFPLTKLSNAEKDLAHTVIGREGESCDIGLTGDDWASRRHARITRRDDRFYLEDLQSKNGTFIRITSRVPLRYGNPQNPGAGDVVLIGEILFRVLER